jgi:hypothetical protein
MQDSCNEHQTERYFLSIRFCATRPADSPTEHRFQKDLKTLKLLAMCYRTAPKHPACGHAAHGTALESSKLEICRSARSSNTRCLTSPWKMVDVARPFCDHCIAHGEILAQSRGLDPGLYCQRMNVSYHDLESADPGVFPAARHESKTSSSSKRQDVLDSRADATQYAGKKHA